MKYFFLLLMAVIILPSMVFSFNCTFVSDIDSCTTVTNSNLSISSQDEFYAGLLYPYTTFPNHEFIRNYNMQIIVKTPPNTTLTYSKGLIDSSWVQIMNIMPSVMFNNTLLIPESVNILTRHGYNLIIPANYNSPGYSTTKNGDCKTINTLTKNTSSLTLYDSNVPIGNTDIQGYNTDSDISLNATFIVDAILSIDHYKWNKYCCKWYHNNPGARCIKYCYSCDYKTTETIRDTLSVSNTLNAIREFTIPNISLVLQNNYTATSKFDLTANNYSLFRIQFDNSSIEQARYAYSVVFSQKPYYFITLKKSEINRAEWNNLIIDNNTLWVSGTNNCTISTISDFSNKTETCSFTSDLEPQMTFAKYQSNGGLNVLLHIGIVALIVYILFMILKYYNKKYVIFVLLFLCIPFVSATDCGLSNLASCIPNAIFDFFMGLLNAPLQPLLGLVKTLLETVPSIDIFSGIWALVVYILSMFYSFLFIYAGIQFMTSGLSPLKRYLAKEWLKNSILLILFVQMSFYLYGLFLDIGSVLTSATLQLIDPNYFLLTTDNLSNVGLELLFTWLYVLILLITVILLTIRFMTVAFGVIFIPIGIFCYFIPPLKSYGKFILNIVGMLIFITFLDSLILLASSWIVQLDTFSHIKILVMICGFMIIDYLMLKLIGMVIGKSSFEAGKEQLADAVKYIAMFAG